VGENERVIGIDSLAKNKRIEMQSAVDPIRTVFNCGYSP
jgi:hypothetical protein